MKSQLCLVIPTGDGPVYGLARGCGTKGQNRLVPPPKNQSITVVGWAGCAIKHGRAQE